MGQNELTLIVAISLVLILLFLGTALAVLIGHVLPAIEKIVKILEKGTDGEE